jgi:hypothetical protein
MPLSEPFPLVFSTYPHVEAFETILFLEKVFGTQLREYAIKISRERWEVRQEILGRGFQSAMNITHTSNTT